MLLQRSMETHADDHLDMTPMVDVVFQLMTYLLLTYNASVEAEVDIPRARYGIGIEERDAIVLTLAPGDAAGQPPRVFLGPHLEPKARLEGPDQVRKAVEDGVAQGRRRVVIQADGRIPHGEVLRLGGVAAQVEGVSLNLGVQEEQ